MEHTITEQDVFPVHCPHHSSMVLLACCFGVLPVDSEERCASPNHKEGNAASTNFQLPVCHLQSPDAFGITIGRIAVQ